MTSTARLTLHRFTFSNSTPITTATARTSSRYIAFLSTLYGRRKATATTTSACGSV